MAVVAQLPTKASLRPFRLPKSSCMVRASASIWVGWSPLAAGVDDWNGGDVGHLAHVGLLALGAQHDGVVHLAEHAVGLFTVSLLPKCELDR